MGSSRIMTGARVGSFQEDSNSGRVAAVAITYENQSPITYFMPLVAIEKFIENSEEFSQLLDDDSNSHLEDERARVGLQDDQLRLQRHLNCVSPARPLSSPLMGSYTESVGSVPRYTGSAAGARFSFPSPVLSGALTPYTPSSHSQPDSPSFLNSGLYPSSPSMSRVEQREFERISWGEFDQEGMAEVMVFFKNDDEAFLYHMSASDIQNEYGDFLNSIQREQLQNLRRRSLYQSHTRTMSVSVSSSNSSSSSGSEAVLQKSLSTRIDELKDSYFGLSMSEKKSTSPCCITFFSPQMSMKEYLVKLEKEDTDKAATVVSILEQATIAEEMKAQLQKALGKHRGVIRQWLQCKTGLSWGDTAGVSLYNRLNSVS